MNAVSTPAPIPPDRILPRDSKLVSFRGDRVVSTHVVLKEGKEALGEIPNSLADWPGWE
jgi:hypothetical protein